MVEDDEEIEDGAVLCMQGAVAYAQASIVIGIVSRDANVDTRAASQCPSARVARESRCERGCVSALFHGGS